MYRGLPSPILERRDEMLYVPKQYYSTKSKILDTTRRVHAWGGVPPTRLQGNTVRHEANCLVAEYNNSSTRRVSPESPTGRDSCCMDSPTDIPFFLAVSNESQNSYLSQTRRVLAVQQEEGVGHPRRGPQRHAQGQSRSAIGTKARKMAQRRVGKT